MAFTLKINISCIWKIKGKHRDSFKRNHAITLRDSCQIQRFLFFSLSLFRVVTLSLVGKSPELDAFQNLAHKDLANNFSSSHADFSTILCII